MTGDNVYLRPDDGGRRCLACKRAYRAKYGIENRELNRLRRKADHAANRDRDLARYRSDRRRIKLEVLRYYGGACACCGEAEIAFLSIDHINGGGSDHRRQITGSRRAGDSMYRWLRRNGYPQGDYQVLCFNCNQGRFVNGGRCPHEETP
jgi:hypothetical protein